MRWTLRRLDHPVGVRLVHDGDVVDCPATRGGVDTGTDGCRTCPVFECLVDDETLSYVVCGTWSADDEVERAAPAPTLATALA